MRFSLIFFFFWLFCAPAYAQEAKPLVVTTFSIIADMAKKIGGEDVEVKTLVDFGADAHGYTPEIEDAKLIDKAAVILSNGLGFDGWIEGVVSAANASDKLVTVTDGIKPEESHHDVHHDDGEHGEGAHDPHVWQDVALARVMCSNIESAFVKAFPDKADAISGRAKLYDRELEALDQEIKSAWNAVPVESRKIVTSHDAFGYYAQAYQVTILAPQGISTENEPSAADIATLIDQIKRDHVRSVFVENVSSQGVIKQIADETGAKVGGTLYADALSKDDADARDYISMLRYNTKLLIDSLR